MKSAFPGNLFPSQYLRHKYLRHSTLKPLPGISLYPLIKNDKKGLEGWLIGWKPLPQKPRDLSVIP